MTITIDKSEALILIEALNAHLAATYNSSKISNREKLSQRFESITVLKSKLSHAFDVDGSFNLKIEKP